MRKRPIAKRGNGRNPLVLQNGPAIREFRELLQWSCASLARTVGVSPSTLSNIEAERRSTTPDVLQRIAEVLGIAPEAITREKETAPRTPAAEAAAP